jgi:hypothetical protein
MINLFTIDNYAINVNNILYLSPNVQNNRTNIHFYDHTVAVAGPIQVIVEKIDEHIQLYR